MMEAGSVATVMLALLLGAPADDAHRPVRVPPDLPRLATSFTCTETVTVERGDGKGSERASLGSFSYLLALPHKARLLPYRFEERREPRPDRAPFERIPQPPPFSWLNLERPDPEMFRKTGSCEHDDGDTCERFRGGLAFRDGRDPREWEVEVVRDAGGRLVRVEAWPPEDDAAPRDRLFGRHDGGGIGGMPGAPGTPGAPELPGMRLDATVERIRCEVEFDELLAGRRLPSRSACHLESVRVGGKTVGRWTLLREFTACREFGVETREEID